MVCYHRFEAQQSSHLCAVTVAFLVQRSLAAATGHRQIVEDPISTEFVIVVGDTVGSGRQRMV